MSYYQGDFYQGDFYRGDPGFFSFLGRAVKGIAGSVLGLGGGSTKIIQAAPATGTLVTRGTAALAKMKGIPRIAGRVIAKHPVLSAAGAAGVVGLGGGALAARAMGGTGRRRRRMNVCNPRALRRSIRRTQGFARLAMRTIHLVHPKKKVRFGGFKKRRRRAA